MITRSNFTSLWSYSTAFDQGGSYLARCVASDREVHMQFAFDYFNIFSMKEPISMATRTNAWVCGLSLAEIVVSKVCGTKCYQCNYKPNLTYTYSQNVEKVRLIKKERLLWKWCLGGKGISGHISCWWWWYCHFSVIFYVLAPRQSVVPCASAVTETGGISSENSKDRFHKSHM